MKKLMLVMMLAVLSLVMTTESFALFGFGKKKKATTKLEQIQEKGKLVVGTSAGYPPFEFHKVTNGKDKIMGIDIELSEAIAKELGVELKIVDMNFDGLLAALKAGSIDFIAAGMSATDERKKQVDFSMNYYEASNVVVTRKELADNFATLADLADKKVGVQKASVQEKLAQKEISDAKFKALSKIPDLILEIDNKKLDAVVLEKPTALAYVANNPNLAIADAEFANVSGGGFAMAVNKSQEDFLNAINAALKKNASTEQVDTLLVKYSKLAKK